MKDNGVIITSSFVKNSPSTIEISSTIKCLHFLQVFFLACLEASSMHCFNGWLPVPIPFNTETELFQLSKVWIKPKQQRNDDYFQILGLYRLNERLSEIAIVQRWHNMQCRTSLIMSDCQRFIYHCIIIVIKSWYLSWLPCYQNVLMTVVTGWTSIIHLTTDILLPFLLKSWFNRLVFVTIGYMYSLWMQCSIGFEIVGTVHKFPDRVHPIAFIHSM